MSDHTKSVLLQSQTMLTALIAQLGKKGYLDSDDMKEIYETASGLLPGGNVDNESTKNRLRVAFGPPERARD